MDDDAISIDDLQPLTIMAKVLCRNNWYVISLELVLICLQREQCMRV